MFDRKHLESLLKINGLESTSPEEEVRSVLLNAKFKEDAVETALVVLRENTQTKQTRVDGLHKVFRTDEALKPAEISKLLGVEIAMNNTVNVTNKTQNKLSILHTMLLWVLSLVIAMAAVLSYMYSYDMGVFRPENSYAAYENELK